MGVSALTALGVVLLVLSLAINVFARLIVRRGGARRRGGDTLVRRVSHGAADRVAALVPRRPRRPGSGPPLRDGLPVRSRSRRVRSGGATVVIHLCVVLAVLPLVLVLKELIMVGGPAISPSFFTELPPSDPFTPGGGIGNALVGTLIMMGIATAIAAPLGILSALFLVDASARGPLMRPHRRGRGVRRRRAAGPRRSWSA